MKKVVNNTHVEIDNTQLKINVGKDHSCYFEILLSMKEQLDNLLSYHSKIIVVRFDLHMREYTATSTQLSCFIRRLRKRLKQRYNIERMGFIWVREIEKAKRQHYHFALMVDANKVAFPAKVLRLIEQVWELSDNPKPYTPKNCYRVIHRGDQADYSEVFYRLSYMAKVRGKGYKSKAANDYSSSRIKPNTSP